MWSRSNASESGNSSDWEAADVVHRVEIDADNMLDDSVPWEYSDSDDDAE